MASGPYLREPPSPALLARYPNWVNAGLAESDEDVLTVEGQQEFISDCTELTAARVTLADGTVCDAYLTLLPDYVPQQIAVFDGSHWWALQSPNYDGKTWKVAQSDSWIPPAQQLRVVSMRDPAIFPLTVVSCLPVQICDSRIALLIRASGRSNPLIGQ